MVKVKIIKDNKQNDYSEYANDGFIYEAFIDFKFGRYCVNFYKEVRFVEKDCIEEFEEPSVNEANDEIPKPKYDNILLVEDGSVDVDAIEEDLGIKCIVYRQGARKPEWLGE